MINRYSLYCLACLVPLWMSCGYALVNTNIGDGKTIDVQIPNNGTNWRSLEVQLGSSLRENLQSLLAIRLGQEQADLVLKSNIRDARRGAPVRNPDGSTLLGSSYLAVEWSLETRQGKQLANGELEQSLEFLPGAGEDPYSALAEIIDWMAESIVIEIHAGLEADASSTL